MGTDIKGYVQVNTIEESTEDLWFDVIAIDMLAERNYSVFSMFFGVRGNCTNPIAPDRGLPEGYENQQMRCESIVGHSWVTHQELVDASFKSQVDTQLVGWHFILDSMAELASRFGSDNVRLVVAFDNHG